MQGAIKGTVFLPAIELGSFSTTVVRTTFISRDGHAGTIMVNGRCGIFTRGSIGGRGIVGTLGDNNFNGVGDRVSRRREVFRAGTLRFIHGFGDGLLRDRSLVFGGVRCGRTLTNFLRTQGISLGGIDRSVL